MRSALASFIIEEVTLDVLPRRRKEKTAIFVFNSGKNIDRLVKSQRWIILIALAAFQITEHLCVFSFLARLIIVFFAATK